MSKINIDIDCTRRCKSRSHGQALTSAITKRSVNDESLASFIKGTCANFTKAFDFEGRTALHMSASRGRTRLMEWLVHHSTEAFVNARDRESGYTPLHRSIFYGQIHSAVKLMKLGANTDIVDKDDYKALEHAMLDRHYIFKPIGVQPNDVYVWGCNSNYTLSTGTQQQRNTPDLLTCFSRTNNSVKQVCLGKFHSIWVCEANGGEVWCGGQTSRAGGPHYTALRPAPIRLPEPCVAAAITLTSTVFLLQSGAVVQYGLNSTDNVSSSNVKTPSVIKLPATKPLLKLADPIGVCAGRSHAVAWNPRAVYTWGTNLGQLGHLYEDQVISAPKRVAVSINTKEQVEIQLVAASDAGTVFTTSRGDVYLLHKYICKKIAIKQINLRQVCVESKVSDQGVYSRVTVLLLTTVGQLYIWQDTTNRLTRCVFGLSHQTYISHVALTHDALYFVTNYGEAFVGNISRKTSPVTHTPVKRDKEKDRKSALVKFLEKDDCTPVRIMKIPNIHRAVSIAVDNEGLNFACLQVKPICDVTSLPELSPSSLPKHMETLLETASENDILHDVVFKVGTKLFPAHIFVVASSSEHIYQMYRDLRKSTDNVPIISLDNVHPEVFERILRYMYVGTCDVAELGPCSLKIKREDLKAVVKKENDNVDTEIENIENPMEVTAFEVYKSQNEKSKQGRRNRRSTETPQRTHLYCDPVKLVQATAKRLQVMGLHKLLDKYYYREGTVYLKDCATDSNVSLRWQRDTLPELVDTNVCSKDGTLIPAHKCVLAARLEYFQGMFMHSWTESKLMSTVSLPINHGILLPVINFLYTDSCPEIENSDSIDFICSMLIVADQLFISRLREMCEVTLASLVTLKNCAELCQFSHTYNASQLKQFCMEFISLNICNVLENHSLDLLEETLLEDISKYYCKFNPIMSSRVITPFFNCPSDETIDEFAKTCPVDLNIIDEELKKEESLVEVSKKKKQSKKIEYTESEKARMRYESVSSVTSLDMSNDNSGDVTLSLSSIEKTSEKKDKWIEVPSAQQKQQKVIQARLKAITTAKDIMNETSVESFTKLTKSISSSASPPSRDNNSPSTSHITEHAKEIHPLDTDWSPRCSLVINHIGPKLSQKQRKKLAMQGNSSAPQYLDNYLCNKSNLNSPPEKPKNPWKICEPPVASSSPQAKPIEFNKILADQKKQKDDFSRIMTKSLALTQLEDKAIEELERFYNVHEVDDELITVRRIELHVASPQWIHTAPN